MKPENRQIFEDNRKHHDTLVKAGYLKHLSGLDRSNLVKAMSEEFQPGYTADLWCPPCVSNMILQVYRRYDQFLEEEKRLETVTRLAEIEKAAAKLIEGSEAKANELIDHSIQAAEQTTGDDLPEPESKDEAEQPPIQTKANFPSHKHHRRR